MDDDEREAHGAHGDFIDTNQADLERLAALMVEAVAISKRLEASAEAFPLIRREHFPLWWNFPALRAAAAQYVETPEYIAESARNLKRIRDREVRPRDKWNDLPARVPSEGRRNDARETLKRLEGIGLKLVRYTDGQPVVMPAPGTDDCAADWPALPMELARALRRQRAAVLYVRRQDAVDADAASRIATQRALAERLEEWRWEVIRGARSIQTATAELRKLYAKWNKQAEKLGRNVGTAESVLFASLMDAPAAAGTTEMWRSLDLLEAAVAPYQGDDIDTGRGDRHKTYRLLYTSGLRTREEFAEALDLSSRSSRAAADTIRKRYEKPKSQQRPGKKRRLHASAKPDRKPRPMVRKRR